MKSFLLTLLFLAATGFAGKAQPQPVSGSLGVPPAYSAAGSAAAEAAADSTQQAVAKLFRRNRLFGLAGTIAGGLLLGSGVAYTAGDGAKGYSSLNMGVGAAALVLGVQDLIRFSRHREQRVLSALKQGQALPTYIARRLPRKQTGPKNATPSGSPRP